VLFHTGIVNRRNPGVSSNVSVDPVQTSDLLRSSGISETMWKLQELVGQVYNLSQWAYSPQKCDENSGLAYHVFSYTYAGFSTVPRKAASSAAANSPERQRGDGSA